MRNRQRMPRFRSPINKYQSPCWDSDVSPDGGEDHRRRSHLEDGGTPSQRCWADTQCPLVPGQDLLRRGRRVNGWQGRVWLGDDELGPQLETPKDSERRCTHRIHLRKPSRLCRRRRTFHTRQPRLSQHRHYEQRRFNVEAKFRAEPIPNRGYEQPDVHWPQPLLHPRVELPRAGLPPAASVFQTNDGGRSWTNDVLPPHTTVLSQISCASVADCVAAGGGWNHGGASGPPDLLTTSDGGTTWVARSLPASILDIHSISCPSASSCMVVGSAGPSTLEQLRAAVAVTDDGGATWTTP
jgi:hypothetical protein